MITDYASAPPGVYAFKMVERHPSFADDPSYQPGGMYWHLDNPNYHEVRADVLETLAVMSWEELIYLRDGSVPQGSGLPQEAPAVKYQDHGKPVSLLYAEDLRPKGTMGSAVLRSRTSSNRAPDLTRLRATTAARSATNSDSPATGPFSRTRARRSFCYSRIRTGPWNIPERMRRCLH